MNRSLFTVMLFVALVITACSPQANPTPALVPVQAAVPTLAASTTMPKPTNTPGALAALPDATKSPKNIIVNTGEQVVLTNGYEEITATIHYGWSREFFAIRSNGTSFEFTVLTAGSPFDDGINIKATVRDDMRSVKLHMPEGFHEKSRTIVQNPTAPQKIGLAIPLDGKVVLSGDEGDISLYWEKHDWGNSFVLKYHDTEYAAESKYGSVVQELVIGKDKLVRVELKQGVDWAIVYPPSGYTVAK